MLGNGGSGELGSGVAVEVHIEEAGYGDQIGVSWGQPDTGDDPLFDFYVSGNEVFTDDARSYSKTHHSIPSPVVALEAGNHRAHRCLSDRRA
jgi:hypothetical protein